MNNAAKPRDTELPTSGTHDLRFGASYPMQLAPSPDYALASEDLGNLPERCSCDEAVTLLALLASARAHVPAEDTDWHARAAAMLSGA
jgi:hypothetical protein